MFCTEDLFPLCARVDQDLRDFHHLGLPAAPGARRGRFRRIRLPFVATRLLVTWAVVRQMNHHLAMSVSTEPAAIALLAEIRFQAPQSLTDGHWSPFL